MTTTDHPRSRRTLFLGLAGAGLVIAAVLAFGVFGVQTLFIDDEVSEAGPDFASGASAAAPEPSVSTTTAVPAAGAPDEAPEAPTTTTTAAPQVVEAGRGTFQANDHPGTGTAVVLSDGLQTFVRFEDDFETDNGPDLFAVIYVDGQRIELEPLKGNRGAQNYEVPSSIDAASIEAVAVWCKRFDSTFTTAQLG